MEIPTGSLNRKTEQLRQRSQNSLKQRKFERKYLKIRIILGKKALISSGHTICYHLLSFAIFCYHLLPECYLCVTKNFSVGVPKFKKFVINKKEHLCCQN